MLTLAYGYEVTMSTASDPTAVYRYVSPRACQDLAHLRPLMTRRTMMMQHPKIRFCSPVSKHHAMSRNLSLLTGGTSMMMRHPKIRFGPLSAHDDETSRNLSLLTFGHGLLFANIERKQMIQIFANIERKQMFQIFHMGGT